MKAIVLALALLTSTTLSHALSLKDQHRICKIASDAVPMLYMDQGSKNKGEALAEVIADMQKLADEGKTTQRNVDLHTSILLWTDLQVSKVRPILPLREAIQTVSSLCAIDPSAAIGM